jgi:hypothetical protein
MSAACLTLRSDGPTQCVTARRDDTAIIKVVTIVYVLPVISRNPRKRHEEASHKGKQFDNVTHFVPHLMYANRKPSRTPRHP